MTGIKSATELVADGLALAGKDGAKALELYDMAIAADPDFFQAYCHKDELLREMGSHGQAVECFAKAIEN